MEIPKVLVYFTFKFPGEKNTASGYNQKWPSPDMAWMAHDPTFLWPEQHPVAESKSQTAHTAAEAEAPVHMAKASSPAPSKSECDPMAYGTC